jgi:hypothetical protein
MAIAAKNSVTTPNTKPIKYSMSVIHSYNGEAASGLTPVAALI